MFFLISIIITRRNVIVLQLAYNGTQSTRAKTSALRDILKLAFADGVCEKPVSKAYMYASDKQFTKNISPKLYNFFIQNCYSLKINY